MYQYSKEMSQILIEKYSEMFNTKQCYKNVFEITTGYIEEISSQHELKFLFCYFPSANNIYIRHVFCVLNDMIIEPLQHLDVENNIERIVVIKELGYSEYLDLVLKEKSFDLTEALIEYDVSAYVNSNIELNVIDLVDLVSRIVSCDEIAATINEINAGNRIILTNKLHGE